MALTGKRAAFFDVDNTLIRGSTIYFLGRGMYQRGYFTKKDISRFVLANLRFRLTGKENKEEIARFQSAATDFIGGHNVKDICGFNKAFISCNRNVVRSGNRSSCFLSALQG